MVVSIVGRHIGGAISHRIITGHYYRWWAGLIKGSVDSLLAIAPSLGLLRLLLNSGSSTWTPFVVAIVYPTILALFSERPDKLQIAQMRATVRGAIGPPEPFSRSAIDREEREVYEEYKEKRLFFWCQLIGYLVVIGLAAVAWRLTRGPSLAYASVASLGVATLGLTAHKLSVRWKASVRGPLKSLITAIQQGDLGAVRKLCDTHLVLPPLK